MPDSLPTILFYCAVILAVAISLLSALRARRRNPRACVFCDGVDGAHQSHCQRPGGR